VSGKRISISFLLFSIILVNPSVVLRNFLTATDRAAHIYQTLSTVGDFNVCHLPVVWLNSVGGLSVNQP
jgi:hypothetical protein